MKKNFKLTLIILFLVFSPLTAILAQNLSSSELIKNSKEYDGKIITYSGEVIGDVMLQGAFAWVNINDGQNALGVWMNAGPAKEINFTGNYKSRGDILEVSGIFHRACLEHGGDLDIHAQKVRKVSDGKIVNQKLNLHKVNLSLILLGIIFLIWILTLFKRK